MESVLCFYAGMLGCWDALVSISPQLVHARYHATYSAVDRVLVGVLVPQSLTEYSTRSTVQYRLCFVVGWGRLPDFVTFAYAILRIWYCNIRTSARFHEVVFVCVTAIYSSRYCTSTVLVLYAARDPGAHKCITGTSIICPPEGPLDTVLRPLGYSYS